MDFSTLYVIGVSYEPLPHTGETLVVMACRQHGKVFSLQAPLPMERHKIPSDQVAAMFAMNALEVDEYKCLLPIPAHWNIPTKSYI